MSNEVLIVLLMVGLVLSLWLNSKYKINAGLVAIGVSWLVGCWFGKLSPTAIINLWPISVMFIAITVTLFFGYAHENGTLMLFAEKMMYITRNIRWFPPIALYLISFIIGAAGAGAMATEIFMSAVAFALVEQTGMNPLLAILAVFLGGCGGGGMFWSSEGANRIAYYTQAKVNEDTVLYSTMAHSAYTVIIFTIVFIIGYIVFKGWRNKATELVLKKPEPFNKKQKINLAIIVAVIVLVVGSAFLKTFVPTNFTKLLNNNFPIQMTALIGFLACFALNLADPKGVMKRVPWDLILTVGGMTMMISVGLQFGVTKMVAGVFSSGIPVSVIPFIFLIIAGFLSLFSNFTVIYPLLMPLIPVVAKATGANSVTLFTFMALGSMMEGMSPFSTGGACCLTGCPTEELRQKLVPKQLIMTIACLVIIAIISFTPIAYIFKDVIWK